MSGSQKFIARNRAPRVQIEYDVELYGAEKKVQLPFVMGVMSDLSGKAETPALADRAFLEIDVDNFDDRMKAMAPRAQFTVPNTLTGEGSLAVDLTFEKLSDFSPTAIAGKVDTLRPLLEARQQLSDLMAYMDGKSGAEALIETLLHQPALLSAVSGKATNGTEADAVLDSLRAAAPAESEDIDTTGDTLAALRATAPENGPEDTAVADALSTLTPPPEEQARDNAADVLAAMDRSSPEAEEDRTADILAGIEPTEVVRASDKTDEVLAGIEVVETPEESDETTEVLAGLEAVEVVDEADQTKDVLASVEAVADAAPEVDEAKAVLAGIEAVSPEDTEVDAAAEVLAGLEVPVDAEPAETDIAAEVLAGIEVVETPEESDETAEVLAGLEAVEVVNDADQTEDILASVEAVADAAPEVDAAQAVLAGIEAVPPEDTEVDAAAEVLAGLEVPADAEPAETDNAAEVLAGIEVVETPEESDETAEVLAGLEAVEVMDEADQTEDILASVEAVADAVPEVDEAEAVLAGIEAVSPEDTEVDAAAEVLAGLEAPADVEPAETDIAAEVLAGIEVVETPEESDETAEVLAGLEAVEVVNEADETEDILASVEAVADAAPEVDAAEAILAGIEADEAAPDAPDTTDAVFGEVAASEPGVEVAEDAADKVLAGIEADLGQEADEQDSAETVLAGLEAPVVASDETQDAAEILASLEAVPDSDDAEVRADDVLAGLDAVEGNPEDAGLDDILAGVEAVADDASSEAAQEEVDALLSDLAEGAPAEVVTSGADDVDDLLSDLSAGVPEAATPEDDDLDSLLSELSTGAKDDTDTDVDDDLDALLSDLAEDSPEEAETGEVDDLLADLSPETSDTEDDDLDALLSELSDEAAEAPDEDGGDPDAILAESDGLDADEDEEEALGDLDALLEDLPDADESDDLDALLADLSGDEDAEADVLGDPDPGSDVEEDEDDLDALLTSLDAPDSTSDDAVSAEAPGGDDLDALLADLGAGSGTSADDNSDADTPSGATSAEDTNVTPRQPVQNPFGRISAPRPAREDLNRSRFRMALFGDFTGRAAKGLMETGDALAARKPIELDVDTVEDVIEGFATTLTLPIGKDGAGIDVPLKEFDDLHPDELFDNVEIFDALAGLKQQLGIGSMADRARAQLKGWSETYGTPIRLPKRSAATSVPANKTLSDFQALIGDTSGTLTQSSPIDEMIARIVGPHIVASPDADAKAMQAAVDEALSSAMRLILHHPEFQAVESQWRSLDLLARRIETDVNLQIVLYDVSAEEMAADLAAQEDLAQSGLFRLLTDVLDPETGSGGFSALFGLYTFEETPPHAELLARIGAVAAHVDAPFFAAMTPGYLETAKEDRHPLVAKAWDQLRALPEAGYLGLASPRFLLRQPYGAKSDPIDPFEFEEFTPQEGLSGMLWANPVVLVAILLAGTYKKDGKAMNLGSLMSLGEMPFHFVADRYGDQVALPCTERNLTSDPAQATLGRGFMPVLWVKGRNEIRLGSFRSLGGEEIAGPWSGAVPPSRPAAPTGPADIVMDLPDGSGDGDDTLDDLLAAFDDEAADDDTEDGDLDDMDPELAALLEGL